MTLAGLVCRLVARNLGNLRPANMNSRSSVGRGWCDESYGKRTSELERVGASASASAGELQGSTEALRVLWRLCLYACLCVLCAFCVRLCVSVSVRIFTFVLCV